MARQGMKPCTDEEFVLLWQTAECLQDVAVRAGYGGSRANRQNACHRARRLRLLGVDLRTFREPPDVARLARLAQEGSDLRRRRGQP